MDWTFLTLFNSTDHMDRRYAFKYPIFRILNFYMHGCHGYNFLEDTL